MQVPVNIRDDRNAHGSRATLAKAAAVLALVAVWIASGALLWRTQVPRLPVPQLDPREYFSADALERIASFRRVSRLLLLATLGLEIAVLAALVWKAGAVADWLGGVGRGRIRTGVLVGLAIGVSLWVAALPLGAASHWWRRRYGLSEQGYGGWLRDQAVAIGVEAVLVAGVVAGAMWLATRLGGSWWLAGAPALAGLAVLVTLAQPLVVQPLFNRFEPLRDSRLTRRIEELARREGVHVDKVLVADASRRTTTANAYVAGLGPTKRVVLYDTMLDGRFTQGEIEVVAAHELGHVARSHLWKGLAWFALLAVPGVFLVAWVTERRGGLTDPAVVPLAVAVALGFVLLTQPFGNLVSRRYEAEADWLALEATRDPAAAVGLERRFVLTSLGDPDPPAWAKYWLGTHPTPLERIGMAEAFRILRAAREGS
jgi:Zn-dependent protease with chaperone function